MKTPLALRLAQTLISAGFLLAAGPAAAAPVLLVSVDGMKPEYVFEAGKRGLKLPFLTGLMKDGTYADGVTGVWPTVTYPSHTTLVTGVAPLRHGIFNNLEFDPRRTFDGSWYWYSRAIPVQTLWQAAKAEHLSTASIGWPVTVGAADIDYLIPEYWRVSAPTDDLNPTDRYLIDALTRPAGLLKEFEPDAGPYMMGNDTTLLGDQIKARYAAALLRKYHPALLTLHLSSLDDAEHDHGPFSAEANADLEAIDGLLAQVAAAAREVDPSTVVIVVSDHGFLPLTHRVNLAVSFVRAGLMTLEPGSGRIKEWTAQPWAAGGMYAILMKPGASLDEEKAVGTMLRELAADPKNGIARIDDRAAVRGHAGFPGAAYVVVMAPGYYAGGELKGDLVTELPPGTGGHGFSPEFPEMRAALFAAGPGIAAGRDLGVIDMRQIAPAVARVLGTSLSKAAQIPKIDLRAGAKP